MTAGLRGCWNRAMEMLEPVEVFAATGGELCWNWSFFFCSTDDVFCCDRHQFLLESAFLFAGISVLFCWNQRPLLLEPERASWPHGDILIFAGTNTFVCWNRLVGLLLGTIFGVCCCGYFCWNLCHFWLEAAIVFASTDHWSFFQIF